MIEVVKEFPTMAHGYVCQQKSSSNLKLGQREMPATAVVCDSSNPQAHSESILVSLRSVISHVECEVLARRLPGTYY
jgi:hypothetical protein